MYSDHLLYGIMQQVEEIDLEEYDEISEKEITPFITKIHLTTTVPNKPPSLIILKHCLISSNYNIKTSLEHYKVIEEVKHPQFPKLRKYEITADFCEALFEDIGVNVKRAEYSLDDCLSFAKQILDGFYQFEVLGYKCIGATMKEIKYDSKTNTYNFTEDILEKIIPIWLPPNYYLALDDLKKEYVGPELIFYYEELNSNLLKKQPCISDEVPLLDLFYQDVYSWGTLVYYFMTGKFCNSIHKRSKEAYKEFIKSLSTSSFVNDEKGKVLMSALELALAFDPKKRPSFYTLKKFFKTNTIFPWCNKCGKALTTDKCSFCNEMLKSITNEVITEDINKHILSIAKKNPYTFINNLQDAYKLNPSVHYTTFTLKLFKELISKYNTHHVIALLKESAEISLKSKEYETTSEIISTLIRHRRDSSDPSQSFGSHLAYHISLLLLPVGDQFLPNSCAVQRVNTEVTVEDYKTHFKNLFNLLYENEIQDVPILECFNNIQKALHCNFTGDYIYWEPTGRSVKELGKKLKRSSKSYELFVILVINESVARFGLTISRPDIACDAISTMEKFMTSFYDKNDSEEIILMYNMLSHFIKKNKNELRKALKSFEKIKTREGNINNRILVDYFNAYLFLENVRFDSEYEAMAKDALERLIRITKLNLPDASFQSLKVSVIDDIGERFISLKKYAEAEEYVKKATEGYKKLNKINLYIKVLIYQSAIQRYKKLPEEAKRTLDNAYQILESNKELNDSEFKSTILFELGNYEFRNKNYEKARKYFDRIVTMFSHDNSLASIPKIRTKAEVNIANCYRKLDLISKAKSSYKEVISSLQSSLDDGSIELVKALVNLGTLYAELKNKDKAMKHIETAKQILAIKKPSILHKRVNAIAMKVEAMPPELINNIIINTMEKEMITIFSTTEEEQTIREIIANMKDNNDRSKLSTSFAAIRNAFNEVIKSSENSGTIKKDSSLFKDHIEPLYNCVFFLCCMGYEEKNNEYVVTKANLQLFTAVVDYLSQFI